MRGYNSISFFYGYFLIGGERADAVYGSGGPVNNNGVHTSGGTEAEVKSGVTGGLETGVGTDFGALSQAGGRDFNFGSEAVAVGALAYCLDTQPVCGMSLVAKEQR